jgi:hypothetical protein
MSHFFHRIQWLQNFFCKTFSLFFSKNMNICIKFYWLNRSFCGVLSQVKISPHFPNHPVCNNYHSAVYSLAEFKT